MWCRYEDESIDTAVPFADVRAVAGSKQRRKKKLRKPADGRSPGTGPDGKRSGVGGSDDGLPRCEHCGKTFANSHALGWHRRRNECGHDATRPRNSTGYRTDGRDAGDGDGDGSTGSDSDSVDDDDETSSAEEAPRPLGVKFLGSGETHTAKNNETPMQVRRACLHVTRALCNSSAPCAVWTIVSRSVSSFDFCRRLHTV